MLEALRERWPYPSWADSRYKRLAWLDAVLAGELFRELKGDFFDESLSGGTGRKAKLSDRKPSVRYNVAGQVARNTARKLFSGRHAPRFTHPKNEKLALAAEALMREGFLKTRILQAVNWGSVGSVAVTFCLRDGGEGVPRIVFNVYRARMCTPSIDSLGELKSLRLWYVISAAEAAKLSTTDYLGREIRPDSKYWFVRDFLAGREVTYVPVEVGSRDGDKDLDSIIQTMDFGTKVLPSLNFPFEPSIVPAHWFVNLSGGEYPDGACTWEDAVPGMIDIAFTLSNLGRGVRYNSTPQLVVRGATRKKSGEQYAPGNSGISRDSAEVIRVSAGGEKVGGEKEGPGDAKLLEMRGNSVKAALEYCNAVRKYSLEQIGASRKDPDRLHFPQSGKAMELLDEDFFDLVGELRTCYGDYGLIPLMKKALTVASAAKHPLLAGVSLDDLDGLALKWPRPYQPTAQEFYLYMQGLSIGVNSKQGGAKGGDGAAPSIPQGVITREEGHALLDLFLDMPAETSTVAIQQQPRREESMHTDPDTGGKGGSDGSLAVQPQGKDLPPKTTSLAPPEYHQQ